MIRVVVQGSLNYDISVLTEKLPCIGQTVIGTSQGFYSGGKGGNQAVQLAKLGAEVYMVGRIGSDNMGEFLKHSLSSQGVNTDFVIRDDGASGIGNLQIDEDGRYYAIVVPNANGRCKSNDILKAEEVIASADILLCQLETTLEALECTINLAKKHNIKVVLNTAPAISISQKIFQNTYLVTPNETEASFYANKQITDAENIEELTTVANGILGKGAKRVIITLGSHGCFFYDGQTAIRRNAFSIDAVDTTAAGDAFNAALCYAMAREDIGLENELDFANAAGAIAASRKGAQSSMGTLEEIENLLASRN